MEYFCSILFCAFIGAAASEWLVDDGRNRGISCFEQIIQDSYISNLLIDVTTPDKIDEFCRRHSELQKCTRENEHYMSVKENTDYLQKTSGVHNFYVNVCPPGTDITADYKGNAPCFKLIKNEILKCGSDLPDLNSYKMKNDVRFRCCSLQSHNECLKKVTAENCGKEAAVVVEKILLRYFDRKLKECNSSSYSCVDGGHTTVQDWTTSRRYYTTKLNLPTTREYKYRGTSVEEDWKRSTAATDKRVEWKRVTEADGDVSKKRHHHNGSTGVIVNSAISVLSCFVAILLHKL